MDIPAGLPDGPIEPDLELYSNDNDFHRISGLTWRIPVTQPDGTR